MLGRELSMTLTTSPKTVTLTASMGTLDRAVPRRFWRNLGESSGLDRHG